MLDVISKPPKHPRNTQSPSYTDVSLKFPPHLLMGKFRRKKNHRALHGQVLPLLPQGWGFSFLQSVTPNFSPSLFKEQQQAPFGSLGSTEGVEPGGRRAYVTQYAQQASRWGKEMHREMTEKRGERGWGARILKVFSASIRGPSLCLHDKQRKHNRYSETRGVHETWHVFYQTWSECV